jgi:CelD/BcsL family acetyltransferase involved in cellulose biosynthesis
MSLTASIVRDFSALRDLEPAWASALAGSPASCPAALPAWSYGLMARHTSNGDFRILALRDGARLALCLPYLVLGRGHERVLRATNEISPVFCPAPAPRLFEQAFDVLTALHGRHSLMIEHADPRLPDAAALLAAAETRYPALETRRIDDNVLVDLSPGWDAVRAGLSANTREALRRARSRLLALGLRAETRVYSRPDELGEAFFDVLTVDARSWKHVRGGAMALSANEHAQLSFAFQHMSATGQARIYVLRLNARAAAFILTVVIDDRAYMVIWSYADEFSACSPGRLVMEDALRDLAEIGVRRVDFWGRCDAFKLSWSSLVVPRHSVTFHPSRRRHGVRRTAQRATARFPSVVRGSSERYRLKRDPGSPAERALGPITAFLRRRRLARAAGTVELVPADRHGSDGVSCREATELDKPHVPRNLFAALECWHIFERAGRPVAAARIEWWPDRSLYVAEFLHAAADAELVLACARALLQVFPDARRLREPRAEIVLAAGCGLGAAILAHRIPKR